MIASDKQHLRRMLRAIDAARAGRMKLVTLADELLFLRDSLEEVDSAWATQFTSHVATLESAGLASSKQRETMGKKYEELVAETLAVLEGLIANLGISSKEGPDETKHERVM